VGRRIFYPNRTISIQISSVHRNPLLIRSWAPLVCVRPSPALGTACYPGRAQYTMALNGGRSVQANRSTTLQHGWYLQKDIPAYLSNLELTRLRRASIYNIDYTFYSPPLCHNNFISLSLYGLLQILAYKALYCDRVQKRLQLCIMDHLCWRSGWL
jgi:hypothetical protein